MNLCALDIETKPIKNGGKYAALEPFRVHQNKAEISSIAVCYPDDKVVQITNTGEDFYQKMRSLLDSLSGCKVFAHNAIFDITFLIATMGKDKFKSIPSEILDIKWADTLTLVKWIINGQKPEDLRFSYSLRNLVATFLKDHPKTEEFLRIKDESHEAGQDEDYWTSRGQLDVIMTRALAVKMMDLVPDSMRVGLMTEWSDLVPVSNSWHNGIKIDVDKIQRVDDLLIKKMNSATSFLEIEGSVLSSPQQLGRLLFDQWGLTPLTRTPTGRPSTSGDDIKWIAYNVQDKDPDLAKRMNAVISYKENKTLQSKYIKTLREALDYTEDGYMYGIPKLFGTYTGRLTYSNRTVKDGPKVSIALHQLPRVKGNNAIEIKAIRSLLIAPEGFKVIEADASGQESRLMAIRSGDSVMLEIFNKGLNFHSMTAAAIIGMDYNEFQKEFKKVKSGYFVEQRQLGKLTNLSCNYRIGGKALANKAFADYDTFLTEETGRFLVNTFSRQYSGIPMYWSEVIRSTRQLGYTEAFGGRRYKINKWSEKDRWMSESSAINFPIQGSGGSMKEIAISVLSKKMPECFLTLDMHDGIFYVTPSEDTELIEKNLVRCLNDIDYEKFWGFVPPIPLPYESGSGSNFGELK